MCSGLDLSRSVFSDSLKRRLLCVIGRLKCSRIDNKAETAEHSHLQMHGNIGEGNTNKTRFIIVG